MLSAKDNVCNKDCLPYPSIIPTNYCKPDEAPQSLIQLDGNLTMCSSNDSSNDSLSMTPMINQHDFHLVRSPFTPPLTTSQDHSPPYHSFPVIPDHVTPEKCCINDQVPQLDGNLTINSSYDSSSNSPSMSLSITQQSLDTHLVTSQSTPLQHTDDHTPPTIAPSQYLDSLTLSLLETHQDHLVTGQTSTHSSPSLCLLTYYLPIPLMASIITISLILQAPSPVLTTCLVKMNMI